MTTNLHITPQSEPNAAGTDLGSRRSFIRPMNNTAQQEAARRLRLLAKEQLSDILQKVEAARHELNICDTLAAGSNEPGIVNNATIYGLRYGIQRLQEHLMKHIFFYHSRTPP